MIPDITSPEDQAARAGLAAGMLAYVMWGFLPLLFGVLHAVDPVVVVADRTVWSLLLVGGIVYLGRRQQEVRAVISDGLLLSRLALGAVLLAANWLLYVYAVQSNQVLQASFGYFINPLMNVALARIFLNERQSRWQAIAIGMAVLALLIQAVGLGNLPVIALSLAVTFALYSFIRKTAPVGSITALFVETAVLCPLALAYLGYTVWRDGSLGPHADPATLGLLVLSGPCTAVPLLLFAFAVRKLRFTTVGMLQYIAPSIAFILAVTVFGEHLNAVRLTSFALIWLSLLVYTADSVLRSRRPRPVAANPLSIPSKADKT